MHSGWRVQGEEPDGDRDGKTACIEIWLEGSGE